MWDSGQNRITFALWWTVFNTPTHHMFPHCTFCCFLASLNRICARHYVARVWIRIFGSFKGRCLTILHCFKHRCVTIFCCSKRQPTFAIALYSDKDNSSSRSEMPPISSSACTHQPKMIGFSVILFLWARICRWFGIVVVTQGRCCSSFFIFVVRAWKHTNQCLRENSSCGSCFKF